jgi:hypothetical protein
VDVGVADAAELDVDADVLRAERAAFDLQRLEGRRRGRRAVRPAVVAVVAADVSEFVISVMVWSP